MRDGNARAIGGAGALDQLSQQQRWDEINSMADVVAARMRSEEPQFLEEIWPITKGIIKSSSYPVWFVPYETAKSIFDRLRPRAYCEDGRKGILRIAARAEILKWGTPHSIMSVEAEDGWGQDRVALLDRGWTDRTFRYVAVLSDFMNCIISEAFAARLTNMRSRGRVPLDFWRKSQLHGSVLDRFVDAIGRYVECTGLHLLFHCMHDVAYEVLDTSYSVPFCFKAARQAALTENGYTEQDVANACGGCGRYHLEEELTEIVRLNAASRVSDMQIQKLRQDILLLEVFGFNFSGEMQFLKKQGDIIDKLVCGNSPLFEVLVDIALAHGASVFPSLTRKK